MLEITLALSLFSYIPFKLHQKIQFAPCTLNIKPKDQTKKNDHLQQGGDGKGAVETQASRAVSRLDFWPTRQTVRSPGLTLALVKTVLCLGGETGSQPSRTGFPHLWIRGTTDVCLHLLHRAVFKRNWQKTLHANKRKQTKLIRINCP